MHVEVETGRIFELFVGREMGASLERMLEKCVVYFGYLFHEDYSFEPELVKEMDDEQFETFMGMVNTIKAN